MAAARLRTLTAYLVVNVIVLIDSSSQHTADSDYSDLDLYDDMTFNYVDHFAKGRRGVAQDDFYMMSDFEDGEGEQPFYPSANDLPIGEPQERREDDFLRKRASFVTQLNWFQQPEKVYRYTKHRIPGYDYEELDYMASRHFEECDDRSLWTHCLCQFTCSEPDIVDCYTPCKSGCECKEEYVFDEKTQQCLLPEHCSPREGSVYS